MNRARARPALRGSRLAHGSAPVARRAAALVRALWRRLRRTATAAAPAQPARLVPAATREVLPNGLRLIIQDHRASDIVAVYIWVGVGRALREAGRARLRPLPGAHALQGHGQASGRATSTGPSRAWAGAPTPSPPSTTRTFYIIVPAEQTDTAIELLADMAFRSAFDPAEIEPRARGHLRGSAHRGGQPAHRHRPPALRPGLRGPPVRPPRARHPRHHERGHREKLRAFNQHVLHAREHVAGGGRPGGPERGARHGGCAPSGAWRGEGLRGRARPRPAPRSRSVMRQDVERPEQQALLALGWPAPRADDPDGFAIDLLTSILAGTESSRLARPPPRRGAPRHRRQHELRGAGRGGHRVAPRASSRPRTSRGRSRSSSRRSRRSRRAGPPRKSACSR